MNSTNLKKFMVKLISDEKLKEDFKSVASKGSMEDTYQFALKNSDGGFTKEEFEEYVSELMGEIEYAKETLLKDKSLENVAGGINLGGKEFWEKFNVLETDPKDPTKKIKVAKTYDFGDGVQRGAEGAIDFIYDKEKGLQGKRGKAETIQEGIGAANSVIGIISTLGNIGLGVQDVKKQMQVRNDKALDRKVKHYENMLVIDELEKQCRAMGIDPS